MREDDGRSAGIQRVVHGGGRRVRQVNDDAESIHLFDHQLGTYQSMAHEKEDKKEMYTREWELKLSLVATRNHQHQSPWLILYSAQLANDGAQIAQKRGKGV